MRSRVRPASVVRQETTNAFSRNRTVESGPRSECPLLLETARLNDHRKHEILTRSLRKMERTLDTVLRSIGNPTIASGMLSRSPSPPAMQSSQTRALIAASPSPTLAPAPSFPPPSSPKLHSLPDNALNPLGLLAEASLANRRAQAKHPSAMVARSSNPNETPQLGVASDNYFKPGTSLPTVSDPRSIL